MTYKNVAFIPLRGGSKSITLKNIKKLSGRPLAYWALDAATKCEYIEKVFVSTDSNEIKNIIEKYDSDKVILIGRSEETARDDSSTESAMIEFAESYNFENIVLIQATSPLLEKTDIDNGFEMLLSGKYDSILSGVRQKRFIWKKREDELYHPVNYAINKRPRRQEFDGYLVENGAFYITSRERLLDSKIRISGKIGMIEMQEDTYYEIDEMSDWIIVESILKERQASNNNLKDILKNIKILITDSDGVLTDAGMYYSENGDELKKFNTRDGMGVKLLRENGIKTIIMTGENVELVRRRGEKLEVDEIYLDIKDKEPLVREISKRYNVGLEQIAYIGDDINDLESINIVGFGCSVSDGMENVKNVAKYVTKAKGGQGALREVAEIIIKYKDK